MDMPKYSVKRMMRFMLATFTSCNHFYLLQSVETKGKIGYIKTSIIFIIADDLGFSDIEPFGGNVEHRY